MAIEFKHRGRVWRADTAAEAIELRKLLDRQAIAAAESGELPDSIEEQEAWTPDAVTELLKALGNQQKLFVRALFAHRTLTVDKALEELSLDHASFAGVLSGLSKQLKKQNLKPWQLYNTQVEWKDKGKIRTFWLSNSFRWAAEELGWPDK